MTASRVASRPAVSIARRAGPEFEGQEEPRQQGPFPRLARPERHCRHRQDADDGTDRRASPVLVVRGGKGKKDRAVGLNTYIRDKLAEFTRGMSPDESVFGLTAKSVSAKIRVWADKAGLPHLHTHSLRHYVGTTLFQRRANPRAIQVMMGHENLETTMRYAAVTGLDLKETAELLERQPEKSHVYDPSAGIMTVDY